MNLPPGGPVGALVVDKPAGPTSHDLVALTRRGLGLSRVGHTGTLDPAATGVLVLLLGRVTRLARFMTGHEKTYEADVRLGWATGTYDAAGPPVGLETVELPSRDALEAALDRFRGSFLQTPPPVSAKKVGGRRAYALARASQPVVLAPVPVHVQELSLTAQSGPLVSLRVTCSAGFYVRALAHDLGQLLGTGAHLASLRRTRSGPFDLTQAVTAEQLAHPETVLARIVPPEALLPEMPAVTLTETGCRLTGHGQAVGPGDLAGGSLPDGGPLMRLLDPAGGLVAVAEARPPLLHPLVVLR